MKPKVFGCLGVLLALLLFASVMLNVGLIASHSSPLSLDGAPPRLLREPFSSEQLAPAKDSRTRDTIVQIDLASVITGEGGPGSSMVTEMKAALGQAVEDSRVKAIVLRVDSPGGEVTASDTIYAAVKDAAARKPVVVFMDSIAASGGYYIACGARHIVAHPTAITGSIGVIMQGYGVKGLMEKAGVETRTFKSGAMKDAGSMSRDMTEEERAEFQRLVMQNYERFVGIVSEARGIPVEELKNGAADGRVFLGESAKAHKLVDETGYIEAAYDAAKRLAGIEDAEIIRYARQPRLRDFLGMLGQSQAAPPRVEIDVVRRLLPPLKPGHCYYLWPGAAD